MKIIEVEYLGPPALGGVEAVVEALYRHGQGAGHEMAIWCADLAGFTGPRLVPGETLVGEMKVRRFATRRRKLYLFDPHHLIWNGLDQALAAEARQGAILHIHSLPSYQVQAALAALPKAGGVVITPHHDLESLRGYLKLWRGKKLIGRLRAAAQRHPQLRLAVHTNATRDFWRQELTWPEEQIKIIPNGVYLEEFDRVTETDIIAARQTWPQGEIKILFVGRLARAKAADILLRTLATIPEASLLLIGPDAGEQENLQTLIQQLKIVERAKFLPPPPRSQVCAAFRACDIFVLPSRYGENFGIAAIEAMAASRPVIVSDRGGLPALVTSGQNGLVVPAESPEALGEALQRLIASEDLRQAFGRQGRKLVEAGYTWEKVGEAYFSLFAEAQASRK